MMRFVVGFVLGMGGAVLLISVIGITGQRVSRWITDPEQERNRQRAERMAIRRDMDLHPVEKGEHYR